MTGSTKDCTGALQDPSVEAALCRLAELAREFGADHIASATRAVAERVAEGQFYVACVGQFKRGKSTLLNALVGEAVLPTGVTPITTVPTVMRYGKSVRARARLQGTEWADIGVKAIEEYVSEEKNPENAKRVSGLEIFVPSPLLKAGMCLVDTPGLGSIFAGNTEATHAFIPHIDAAIVVLGADPPLSGDELQLLEIVARQVPDLLFVLNKADRVNQAERAAAIEFARKILEKRLRREVTVVFEVSALERLEARGPARDWAPFIEVLEKLALRSGSSLVRQAADRAVRRVSGQLLAAINEERQSLLRPLGESERYIANMHKTLEQAESTILDLGALLTAEQQRLSDTFAERRRSFLKEARTKAQKALNDGLRSLPRSHNGAAYRRNVNHMAQEISLAQLGPWLDEEARHAEASFGKTARRFLELRNQFLLRLRESGVPTLDDLPEEIDFGEKLRARSHFYFHGIERVAAPASPLLFIADSFLGLLGLRAGMVRDAQEFLDQLLEVNSSRVQSDVDERVRESRKELETETKRAIRDVLTVGDRAVARARAVQAGGASAIEAALARLDGLRHEVIGLVTYSTVSEKN